MPSYGYAIRVCGDDGRTYHYVHLNNDRPGTDDGRGGARWAYAPGIRRGAYVRRGQWIGYMGDSGNAESTPPHVHFEIREPGLSDSRIRGGAYRDPTRLDPFYSLVAARRAGRVPSGVLGPGSRGTAVAAWQRQLRDRLRTSIAVDGVFGPATLLQTVRFQNTAGIQVDGLVGPQTLATAGNPTGVDLLGDRSSGKSASYRRLLRLQRPYLRGDDVRTWQRWMRSRGWRLLVDGIYGPQSERTAREFQRRQGLVVDGLVGPNTWSASRP